MNQEQEGELFKSMTMRLDDERVKRKASQFVVLNEKK